MGDHQDDPAVRIASVLGKLSEQLEEIADNIEAASNKNGAQPVAAPPQDLTPYLKQLNDAVLTLAHRPPPSAPAPTADLAPLLGGLNQALTALAESRPTVAPAPVSAPARLEIASAPSETAAAFMGSMDTVLQIVPDCGRWPLASAARGPRPF